MSRPSQVTQVETTEGPVRGIVEDGVAIFRGVPFACPPMGSLRFRAPVPPTVRTEVLDAPAPAAICPQPTSRLSVALGVQGGRQDENCLTLTIWSPLPVSGLRPVVVWIHGGAFTSGGGALPWYDGTKLARENDIVVVGLNYRLGALGFLCRPGLVDGNMGLLDQIRALEWLEENITNFGGDPGQITLMGQSAGGISIACLLALPTARKLFHRVICLSGGLGLPLMPNPLAVGNRFCESLGIDPDSRDALKRLQKLPVAQILDAQLRLMRETPRKVGDAAPIFLPAAVQGLPADPFFEDAVKAGAGSISALMGTTAEEMRVFQGLDPRLADLQPEDLPDVAHGLFGTSGSSRIERAHRARPGAAPSQLMTDAYTEWLTQGVRRLAVAVADGGGRAWLFRFDWSAAGSGLGACHCIDLPFVFGTFDAFQDAPMLVGADRTAMEDLSRVMRSAIGRFVRIGSPSGSDLPSWPALTAERPVLIAFNSIIHHGWFDWHGVG